MTAASRLGWYVDSAGITHGFKRSANGSKTATIDPPGSTLTNAWSINNSGTIVGTYVDSAGVNHGFTLAGTTYTTFDAPNGALLTEFLGVNSAATPVMVGIYVDSAGVQHGFALKNGTFQDITVPGAVLTASDRINNSGVIVGLHGTNVFGPYSGYQRKAKNFTNINFPSATETRCRGINNAGIIVGRYTDSAGVIHGMMIAP